MPRTISFEIPDWIYDHLLQKKQATGATISFQLRNAIQTQLELDCADDFLIDGENARTARRNVRKNR